MIVKPLFFSYSFIVDLNAFQGKNAKIDRSFAPFWA